MNYRLLLIIFSSIVLYAIFDYIWIGYIMKNYYLHWLAHVIRPGVQWNATHIFAAFFTWTLIVTGLLIFVIPLAACSFKDTFFYGAVFGFILYGLYESTNYAVIYGWQPMMVFVDTLWGAFACGLVAIIMKFLLQRL